MKVVAVNKKYFPWVGGVEKAVHDICKSLEDKIDFTVLVGNNSQKTVKEKINSTNIIRAGAITTIANTPICLSMPQLLKQLKADIYHFHFPYPWGDISYLLARPRGKLIVTYHSDIVRQKLLFKFYRPLMLRFLKKADLIVATSPNMIENSPVLKKFKTKCISIPSAIDVSNFEVKNDEKVMKIKNKYGPRIVLFVGRLIYYKGIEYLIRSMDSIDANLLIIGSGPLKETLTKIAKKVGVFQKTYFLCDISDDELPFYYQAADVFVLPSTERTEAFGLVQLEAMISGTPVVSTNLKTGVPFVNKDGATGFVVKPKSAEQISQAVNKILNDNALKKRMGENGIRRVKGNFTTDILAKNYLAAYNKLIGS